MRKYKYALVPIDRASELNISGVRFRTGQEMLINESDTSTFGEPGESFENKIDRLGGLVITNTEAKQIINRQHE